MMTLINDLLQIWGLHWGPLRLFDYVSTRVVGAAFTSFVLMLLLMPPLIRWLKRKKFGESGAKGDGAVVVDAMREGKKGTPTMAVLAWWPASPRRRFCGVIPPVGVPGY